MTQYRTDESGNLTPFAPHIIRRAFIEGEAKNRAMMQGLYKLTVRRADGTIRRETPWFENLILDSGLNRLGTAGAGGLCEIGTGTAAPAANQTSLQAFSARTSNMTSSTMGAQAASPYYKWHNVTFRFAVGALNGNYTEVGVGWADNQLFSRALITPNGVTPEPITVAADEQLDVAYQIRVYPYSESDFGAGTVSISGDSYDIVGRLANATSNFSSSPLLHAMYPTSFVYPKARAFSGTLGDVTGSPSGTSSECSSTTDPAYSNNSLTKTNSATWGLTDGNVGGVRSVITGATSSALATPYQYQFTPAIPKDATKTLTLAFTCSWSRRT